MTALTFASYTEARVHLKDLLDAADEGRPVSVVRDTRQVAVLQADRLRSLLARVVPEPQAVAEDGGWSLFLPGLPIAADGSTIEDAVRELIDALREYSEDWTERLRLAPNHAEHWELVQFVDLSNDDQLRAWIVGDLPPQRTSS